MTDNVEVVVHRADDTTTLTVDTGTLLRDALRDASISPHSQVGRRANCGGRGLCATCGVRLLDTDIDPEHWHDNLADRFGYPRLSCQIRVISDLAIRIPEKRVWGGRE